MKRRKTDFSKILTELREQGFNDYKMSDLTGINRTTLSKLRTADRKTINYDDGVEIIEVYKKEVK